MGAETVHACLYGDDCGGGQDDADRLAVSVALLARAAGAPETPSEGKVLSPTVLPQADDDDFFYLSRVVQKQISELGTIPLGRHVPKEAV